MESKLQIILLTQEFTLIVALFQGEKCCNCFCINDWNEVASCNTFGFKNQ
jgi:hypothetical protein